MFKFLKKKPKKNTILENQGLPPSHTAIAPVALERVVKVTRVELDKVQPFAPTLATPYFTEGMVPKISINFEKLETEEMSEFFSEEVSSEEIIDPVRKVEDWHKDNDEWERYNRVEEKVKKVKKEKKEKSEELELEKYKSQEQDTSGQIDDGKIFCRHNAAPFLTGVKKNEGPNVKIRIVRAVKNSQESEEKKSFQKGMVGKISNDTDSERIMRIAKFLNAQDEKREDPLRRAFSSLSMSPQSFAEREFSQKLDFSLSPGVNSELTVKAFLKLISENNVESIRLSLPKEDPKQFIEDLIRLSQEKDKDGVSLFHLAVFEKRYEIIQLFRELGVTIEWYDSQKQTPLHYAAQYLINKESSDKEIVLALLQFDDALKLLTKEDSKKITPIGYAKLLDDSVFFEALNQHADSDEDHLTREVKLKLKS